MGATAKIKVGSAGVFPAANLVAGKNILRGGRCSKQPLSVHAFSLSESPPVEMEPEPDG